jgi:2'-5' RNA ligase
VPDRAYDDLVDRLGDAAARRRPVGARLRGGGAFPHAGAARVLWAGVDTPRGSDTDELAAMARGARNAAVTAGVEVDGQRFRPHVTLGRMSRPLDATRWVRLLETYAGPPWTVDELALVSSHLGEGPRGRARHETVATFSLGRAGSGPG